MLTRDQSKVALSCNHTPNLCKNSPEYLQKLTQVQYILILLGVDLQTDKILLLRVHGQEMPQALPVTSNVLNTQNHVLE